MNTYHVSRLDHSDPETSAAIHAVMMAAYRVEADSLGVKDFVPLHRTRAQIAAARAVFFGIFVAGTLVAVAELEAKESGRSHIGSLVAHPSHFRRGLATALLRHILRTHGSDEITVSTGVRNRPALLLYAAQGFDEQCRWTTSDGIPMVTLVLGPRPTSLTGRGHR